MSETTVTIECVSGECLAYADWKPFKADSKLLAAGDSIDLELTEYSIQPVDLEDKPSLIAKIKDAWKAVSVGAADTIGNQVAGRVKMVNNTPATLEVIRYLDYDQWESNPVESIVTALTAGESIEVDIIHANAQTLWVRKLV